MKDYLEAGGVEVVSVATKSVLKAAFAARLIAQGQTWVDMLQWRNDLSQRYNDTLLETGIDKICHEFLLEFLALRDKLTEVDGASP